MTERHDLPRPRRILVALDASPSSLAAARAAATLAAIMHAELLGLFIEDIELLRCAQLPCVSEMGAHSARSRRFDTGGLESQQRAQATTAQRELQRAAEDAGVNWSFQVARGGVPKTLRNAAQDADLTTLGRTGWSPSGHRLGSTTRSILREGRGRFLFPERGVYAAGPMRVLLEDNVPMRELLQAGIALSPNAEPVVQLLAIAPDREAAGRLEAEARDHLVQVGLSDEFRWVGTRPSDLLRTAQACTGGVLIASAHSPSLQHEETLGALIRQAGCPVLVVR